MAERKGVMLAKKLNDRYLAAMPKSIYVQPKINGMRCRAKLLNGRVFLFSSQGNVINSVPHINEAVEKIIPDVPFFQFDGELYNHEMSLQEIGSICRKTTRLDEDYKKISYVIFDTITVHKQSERFGWMHMNRELFKYPLCRLETDYILKSLWECWYAMYLGWGYEGIILRNPEAFYEEGKSSNLLKYKHINTETFPIIGFSEAISIEGEPKGMLGSVTLLTKSGEHFNCGAGHLDHANRIDIWEHPEGFTKAEVDFPELTDRGVPHQPVLRSLR